MLTTTLDGLWVLQVLTGIEVVASELGLRPHLPSVESAEMALLHPVAAELVSAGVISANGKVEPQVVEWLTVLARREVALLLYVHGAAAGEPRRSVLARFAHWWVVLERCGGLVRLSAAGTATTEHSAGAVIGAEIARLCGDAPSAAVRPATVDAGRMMAEVHDRESLRRFLIAQGLERDQVSTLVRASQTDRTVQASLVALQADPVAASSRAHIEPGAVTVIDTADGRLLAECLHRDGATWLIVTPGTTATLGSAVQKMLRRLPSGDNWYSHRKAV